MIDMHPKILAQRQAVAFARIQERGSSIALKLGMEPEMVLRLQASGIRDFAIANLTRSEAVADLLDRIAEDYGISAPAQEAHVINKYSPPAEPVAEAPEEQPPAPVKQPGPKATRSTKSTQDKKKK